MPAQRRKGSYAIIQKRRCDYAEVQHADTVGFLSVPFAAPKLVLDAGWNSNWIRGLEMTEEKTGFFKGAASSPDGHGGGLLCRSFSGFRC